jgi:hypothetical protein
MKMKKMVMKERVEEKKQHHWIYHRRLDDLISPMFGSTIAIGFLCVVKSENIYHGL